MKKKYVFKLTFLLIIQYLISCTNKPNYSGNYFARGYYPEEELKIIPKENGTFQYVYKFYEDLKYDSIIGEAVIGDNNIAKTKEDLTFQFYKDSILMKYSSFIVGKMFLKNNIYNRSAYIDDVLKFDSSGIDENKMGSVRIELNGYPSEEMPALSIFLTNQKTKNIITVKTSYGQNGVIVTGCPSGFYTAFAYYVRCNIGGGYTKATDSLNSTSNNHSLTIFKVLPNKCTKGVKITDWSSEGIPPNPVASDSDKIEIVSDSSNNDESEKGSNQITLSDFKTFVIGKSTDDIKKQYGAPCNAQEVMETKFWYYGVSVCQDNIDRIKIINEDSQKEANMVQIQFIGNIALSVNTY